MTGLGAIRRLGSIRDAGTINPQCRCRMESIGKLTETILAKATTTPSLPSKKLSGPPRLLDKTADYMIPARVWSNWKPAHGLREITRALTTAERSAAQRRVAELEAGLLPFDFQERDVVDSALHGMFAGFRFLRQTGESAEA